MTNFNEKDLVNIIPTKDNFPKMTGRVFYVGCNDVMVSINIKGCCYAMFDKISGKHSFTTGIPFQLEDYSISKVL
jgi:hypothetical protein